MLTLSLPWFDLQCGVTPLHLAAQYGHESVVRLLMNCTGVQVDAPTKIQVCLAKLNIITNFNLFI